MIQLENFGEVFNGIDQWIEECEDLAEGAYRGMAVEAFKYIVAATPEWSGNMAASWRLTLGAPAAGYDETIFKSTLPLDKQGAGSPFSKDAPNHAALHYAFTLAAKDVRFITLATDVFITNNAPYAGEVNVNRRARDGKSFIRQVNLPVEMVMATEQKINNYAELSESRASQLRASKL